MTNDNIEDDILDLEDIIKDCDPGPWYGSLSCDGKEFVICKEFLHDVIVSYTSDQVITKAQCNNLWLMSMSREYFPKLIEEIRRLKEENKELKNDIKLLDESLREAEYANWV
jgi:hypothetical protein